MVSYCVECDTPIDENSMSFEQRLIGDESFCRRCFDRIMLGADDMPYLERPGFLTLG